MPSSTLTFESRLIEARFREPDGEPAGRSIEVRTNPITGRTCRVAFSRIKEKETGTEELPSPPPDAEDTENCPFCYPQMATRTPQLHPDISPQGRLVVGKSVLFPNLFPYGKYSAVSLFGEKHFVEIGKASPKSYTDCFVNCHGYLERVLAADPQAIYMAITQNHLPSAGGSLVHPHLQINADRIASNHHRQILERCRQYFHQTGRHLFSDYCAHEKKNGERYIGKIGSWEWMAAFAPEGFFEIWGLLPGVNSLKQLSPTDWEDLATGVINTQGFYRSLCRNGYNLGLLVVEAPSSCLELRIVILVRSNYAPWVRNDHTGFEVMLGDMTTFVAPEQTAGWARPFFE